LQVSQLLTDRLSVLGVWRRQKRILHCFAIDALDHAVLDDQDYRRLLIELRQDIVVADPYDALHNHGICPQ
jgi:hypothetical protein